MTSNIRLYGREHEERLVTEVDEVIERVLEDACLTPGEPFEKLAERIAWPLKVKVYRRMEIAATPESLAAQALEHLLENLDEEYSDPEGDTTGPTEAMQKAALELGRAIVAEYEPWACEPTGEVLEFTREQVQEMEAKP